MLGYGSKTNQTALGLGARARLGAFGPQRLLLCSLLIRVTARVDITYSNGNPLAVYLRFDVSQARFDERGWWREG
jgi:hypothetical protein